MYLTLLLLSMAFKLPSRDLGAKPPMSPQFKKSGEVPLADSFPRNLLLENQKHTSTSIHPPSYQSPISLTAFLHNTGKMSAITDDVHEKVKVLFLLYAGMDALDVCGPLQVLASAQHDMNNESEIKFRAR